MKNQLNKFLGKKPLIGIGPMSKNCIDATIELSKKNRFPIMLIPSRRQIDFNTGYVNNLTTKKFSKYINNNKNIIICRDHGGPWQSELEKKNNLDLNNRRFFTNCELNNLPNVLKELYKNGIEIPFLQRDIRIKKD